MSIQEYFSILALLQRARIEKRERTSRSASDSDFLFASLVTARRTPCRGQSYNLE